MSSEVGGEVNRTAPFSMPMRLRTSAHSVPKELAASDQDDDATDQYHDSSAHRPEYMKIQRSDRRSIQYRSRNMLDTVQNDDHASSPSGKSSSLTHVRRNDDSNPTDLDAVYDIFSNIQISWLTIPSTSSNRTDSILLRLPPELRTLIWELAFGHCTVHPRALKGNIDWQPQRRRLQLSKWGVSYDPCMEMQTDYELYNLSLQNPETDYWHEDMCPRSGAPGFHNCEQKPPREYHYLIPPVCKQLWGEASDCVWKTVTFAFVTSGDFQHFVNFSGARLDQIRQLCIITPGIDFFAGRALGDKDKFERSWERALKSGVMEQFTSLVGLHLVVRSFWGTSRWDTHTVENLEFPPDECLYLPEIIRVFQALRLHPERTTVLVTNADCNDAYGWEDFTVPKRRRMAQTIRDLLLQDAPDRDWSGPGQSMVVRHRD